MCAEPEEDPIAREHELQARVEAIIHRLLGQVFEPMSAEVFRPMVCQHLMALALSAGVPTIQTMAAMSFNLMMEESTCVTIIPKNMFTFLLTLGIVRDPAILRVFVQREIPDGYPSCWVDTFKDERGTYIVALTPEGGYDHIIVPTDLAVEHIQVNLKLDGE